MIKDRKLYMVAFMPPGHFYLVKQDRAYRESGLHSIPNSYSSYWRGRGMQLVSRWINIDFHKRSNRYYAAVQCCIFNDLGFTVKTILEDVKKYNEVRKDDPCLHVCENDFSIVRVNPFYETNNTDWDAPDNWETIWSRKLSRVANDLSEVRTNA